MANPLRRMVSSSQVVDWFPANRYTTIPSRSQIVNVEYLVVAGGGGGGGNRGGGGGAGGYRCSVPGESSGANSSAESLFQATLGTTYTVTVGAGGAGGNTGNGVIGSDSVFSTITSSGGGRGGTTNTAGGNAA